MAKAAMKKRGERLYTYGDYCTWDDEGRGELIDGVVYDMTPGPSRTRRNHDHALAALWMVNLDQYSPDFGGKTSVYSKSDCEFLPGEAEGDVRKGVGMVFRPDGRYCYVSAAKDAYVGKAPSLMVLEVPTDLPAPLKYITSLPSGGVRRQPEFRHAGRRGWVAVHGPQQPQEDLPHSHVEKPGLLHGQRSDGVQPSLHMDGGAPKGVHVPDGP